MTKVDSLKVNELNGKDDSSSEQLAAKEFLIETFNVTEEDIKKYEVEEFISVFELSEDFFLHEKENFNKLSDVLTVFARLQEDLHKPFDEKKNDFSYLFSAKEYQGELPDITSLCYLSASMNMGTGGDSFVIDFNNNKIYYLFRTAFVYEDIREAEKIVDITEEEQKEIMNALIEAQIDKWDYSYVDKKEPSGELFWNFGMEFDDGTIISYSGKGATADSYPELKDVIFGIAKAHR